MCRGRGPRERKRTVTGSGMLDTATGTTVCGSAERHPEDHHFIGVIGGERSRKGNGGRRGMRRIGKKYI